MLLDFYECLLASGFKPLFMASFIASPGKSSRRPELHQRYEAACGSEEKGVFKRWRDIEVIVSRGAARGS